MKSDKDSVDTNIIPVTMNNKLITEPKTPANQDLYMNSTVPFADRKVLEVSEKFFLIRIHKRCKTLWDLGIVLLCFYLIVSIPFLISFSPSFSFIFLWINLGIDSFFFLDTAVKFFTSYIDERGEVKKISQIMSHYLKSKFVFDLFFCIPFDFIVSIFGYQESVYFTAAWMINLLKVTNLYRSHQIRRSWQTTEKIKSVSSIIELLLYIVLWAHCSACLWFVVIKQQKTWNPKLGSYHSIPDIYEESIDSQYFICFYYGVWLSLGNEVFPSNQDEYIAAACMIVSGAIGTAVLLGEMSIIIDSLHRTQDQFQVIIDDARTNLTNLGVNNRVIFKILDQLAKTQSYLKTHEEHETFTKFVSPSMQLTIAQVIYDPILSSNPVFYSESNLLTFLRDKIKIRFVKDEEEIIIEGQEAKSLFFLVAGEVKVLSFNYKKNKDQEVCFLQSGSHFGELALIYGGERRATCLSEGYSTVAELSKADFFLLSNQNPNILPKMREFTENYKDWTKDFLAKSIYCQELFRTLPSRALNELPFMMKSKKLEKGRYLFKPGDKLNELFILAQGSLEFSVTINDRYIQHLKIKEDIADLNTLDRSTRTHGYEQSYESRNFDLFSVNGLKRKPEIFPYITHEGVLKSCKSEEFMPKNCQTIGHYPQEIVLCCLKPGALINSRLCLCQKISQIQCKATADSVLYTLDHEQMDILCKTYFSFKKAVVKEKLQNNPNKLKEVPLNLDIYQISPKSTFFSLIFKESVLQIIFNNRVQRRKAVNNLSGLCHKLKALISCQKAGNFELAEKIIHGEVLPEHITEDGKLIFEYEGGSTALPASHPIIETFRVALDNLSNPQSICLNLYNSLAQEILNESQRVAGIKKSLYTIKNSLQKYNEKLKKNKSANEENKDNQGKKSKNLLAGLNK